MSEHLEGFRRYPKEEDGEELSNQEEGGEKEIQYQGEEGQQRLQKQLRQHQTQQQARLRMQMERQRKQREEQQEEPGSTSAEAAASHATDDASIAIEFKDDEFSQLQLAKELSLPLFADHGWDAVHRELSDYRTEELYHYYPAPNFGDLETLAESATESVTEEQFNVVEEQSSLSNQRSQGRLQRGRTRRSFHGSLPNKSESLLEEREAIEEPLPLPKMQSTPQEETRQTKLTGNNTKTIPKEHDKHDFSFLEREQTRRQEYLSDRGLQAPSEELQNTKLNPPRKKAADTAERTEMIKRCDHNHPASGEYPSSSKNEASSCSDFDKSNNHLHRNNTSCTVNSASSEQRSTGQRQNRNAIPQIHRQEMPNRHVNPTSNNSSRSSQSMLEIEVGPGIWMGLRGASETWAAVQEGSYAPTKCLSCGLDILVILDAEFVLCPSCRVVSPILQDDNPYSSSINSSSIDGNDNTTAQKYGVGLGFRVEDLMRWQQELNG